MTREERLKGFLERAKDCEMAAARARAAPSLHKLYLDMAAQWHERISRLYRPEVGPQPHDDEPPCAPDETEGRATHLDYLEWLRKGSQHHIASPTKDGFRIEAANDTAECKATFHEIVEHAIANAASARYVILPHAAWGGWERAVIILRRENAGEPAAGSNAASPK